GGAAAGPRPRPAVRGRREQETTAAVPRRQVEQARAWKRGMAGRPRSKEIPPDEARLSLARTFELIGQHDQALKLREQTLARWPGDQARADLAASYFRQASATADPSRKKALLERCVGLREELGRADPSRATRPVGLALALAALGDEELFAGRPDQAGQLYARHLGLYRELYHSDETLQLERQLGLAYYRSATAALRRGDLATSARDFERCLRLRAQF